jgi:hypothetical protein
VKLREVEDLFSGRGCFLPARVQTSEETEAGRGCFLLARSLLAVGAHATGEIERGGGSVHWARLLPSS